MRTILAFAAICSFFSSSTVAATIESDHLDLSRIEAVPDRNADTWRGRQHYLYDDQYTAKTDGAAMAAENACAKELVRVKGKDGKTAIMRTDRCD